MSAVFQYSEDSTLSLPDWFGYTVVFSDRLLRYAIDSWVVPSGKAMTNISSLKWPRHADVRDHQLLVVLDFSNSQFDCEVLRSQ